MVDVDQNGFLDSESGFTDAMGSFPVQSLSMASCQVFACQDGYRGSLAPIAGGSSTVTVQLRPEAGLQEYWGVLVGGNVSGASLWAAARPVGIAGPAGKFCVMTEPGPHLLSVDSEYLAEKRWEATASTENSFVSPELVTVTPLQVEQLTVVVHLESGGMPAPGATLVLAEGVGQPWQQCATATSGVSNEWTAQLDPNSPRLTFANSGLLWGVSSPDLGSSVSAVTIRDQSLEPIEFEFLPQIEGDPAGWGRYQLFVDPGAEMNWGHGEILLQEGSVPASGTLRLDLAHGEYRFAWNTGTFHKSMRVRVAEDAGHKVYLLAFNVQVDAPEPGALPGLASVEVVVQPMDGELLDVRCSLVHPETHVILHSAQSGPEGEFLFEGVAAGTYDVSVHGQSLDGRPYVQLDGVIQETFLGGQHHIVTPSVYSKPYLDVYVIGLSSALEDLGAMPQVDVVLLDSSGAEVLRSPSDDAGRALFYDLPNSVVSVSCDLEGFSTMFVTELEERPGGGVQGSAIAVVRQDAAEGEDS